MSYNQLTGQFAEFQFSDSLEFLSLDNNRLYGSIPKSISNLVNLSFLDMSSNDLNGTVDFNMFKKLKTLLYLNFRANLLHGVLPVPPSSMRNFLISNNRLSGEIPSSICNVTSIEIFDISYNNLSGTIPSCLGNFSNSVVVMDLRRNNFYGTMPETFAEGNTLRTLVFNGNQLEGLLPKSLVNCKYLEVLDIGNNKVNDSFPYWLEDLPVLQVLILRSNKFNGQLDNFKTKSSFSLLRIIDLSHNEFSGSLPTNFFKGLKAIKTTKESEGEVKYMEQGYYQDSVIVAMKGQSFVLERILTIFTTIDLSSNKFNGKIPEVIGMLNFLRGLNYSHNRLTGHIPSSLGHLSVLESLDLSSNRLNGEIPMQLTSLTFLAVLNLSQNQLMGPIPQGKQFGTFQNNSYGGNLGLCGFPLSKNCGIDEQPPPPIFQEDNNPKFMSGFGWKAVLLGYGCGLVFGIAMGYFMFKIGKPQCLLGLIEENRPRKLKMPSNQRSRGSRNYSI